jgi:hypothetical protein
MKFIINVSVFSSQIKKKPKKFHRKTHICLFNDTPKMMAVKFCGIDCQTKLTSFLSMSSMIDINYASDTLLALLIKIYSSIFSVLRVAAKKIFLQKLKQKIFVFNFVKSGWMPIN